MLVRMDVLGIAKYRIISLCVLPLLYPIHTSKQYTNTECTTKRSVQYNNNMSEL